MFFYGVYFVLLEGDESFSIATAIVSATSLTSKIFINGVVVIDAAMDAKIEQKGFEGYVYNTYEIKTKPNIAFGAGYNFNNKFGAEVRYFTSSNITSSFVDYRTNYKALSFILSYNFL